ncbi:MAG: ATP-binding cassette domain-containing protein, partial [Bacteroidota bacterium]
MHLIINNLSKRFASEWIIRDFSLELRPGSPVALTGPNGSGKSTLLQMAAGYMPPTTGTVTYHMAGKPVSPDDVFKYIGIAAPYMELIEEFTLPELINFHNTFKPLAPELNAKAFAERLQIGFFPGKPVKNYSSGMKQRVKLGLALFSDTPLLL